MGSGTAGTTVGVALGPPVSDEVTAFVEAEAGWRVVGAEGPPRPLLVLADRVLAAAPTVVICDGTPEPAHERELLAQGALDVIGWPADRHRLLQAPARVRAVGGGRPVPTLHVAGAGGGVGTTTVALALAGLLAWPGLRVVAVLGPGAVLAGVPTWQGPGAAEVAALPTAEAAAELTALCRPAPGLPGLGLLGGLWPGAAIPDTAGWPVDAVVIDRGVAAAPAPAAAFDAAPLPETGSHTGVDVVVVGADVRCHLAAAMQAPVVLVGEGPLAPRQVAALLGRPPAVTLPRSARVARAGALGRVPAALPGRWLRELRRGLPRLLSRSTDARTVGTGPLLGGDEAAGVAGVAGHHGSSASGASGGSDARQDPQGPRS